MSQHSFNVIAKMVAAGTELAVTPTERGCINVGLMGGMNVTMTMV